MANVFGAVIDNDYVRRVPEYLHKSEITSKDRVAVALKKQYNRGDDIAAINRVKELKSETTVDICTLIVFYNATGNPIEYTNDHDWYGKLGSGHPQRVENGQWACFLHQKEAYHSSGSNGAVVYNCTDAFNYSSDAMIAWDTPWGPWNNNKAYTEVREKNHFDDNNNRWGVVNDKMYRGNYHSDDTFNGLKSKVSTSSGDTPEYVATFYLV